MAFVMIYFNGCTPEKMCEGFTGWNRLKLRGKVKTMTTETYKGLDVSKYNDLEPHPMMEYYSSVCEFDINGEIIKQVLFDANGLFQTFRFVYDKKHRQTEMTVYDKNKNILAIEYSKYSDQENQVETSVFKLDEQLHEVLVKKVVSEYNDKCNEIRASVYDNEGKFYSSTDNKYDTSGFLIEELITRTEGFDYNLRNQFERDNFGNWIAKKVVLNGEFRGQSLKDFISDKANNVYSYDSQGNWLTCQEYLNSEPSRYTVRTFTYW